jgi:hypothetical protein
METENVVPITSVEDAKKVLEQEKQARAQAFQDELKALCEKHQCDLQVPGIVIIPR